MTIPDRPHPAPALIYSLFFLSGFAALVYEASWSRQIGLAIGQTAQAAALVLAAYFAGMAIGQFLGGRLASRISPLLGYGVAELIAAAWGCVVPPLLSWVGSPATPSDGLLFRDAAAGRAAWCFLILLPATIPLGATLPLVIEALAAATGTRRGGNVAYALNTAGGLAGIVAAVVVLMVAVGVRGSGYFAAVLSAACGATACAMALRARGSRAVPASSPEGKHSTAESPCLWPILAAISGFGTLGLEVLYTRLFALIFHNSTYTFAAVIAVFLLALALGAAFAVLAGRWFSPRQVAAASFSLGGFSLAVSIAAFPWLTKLEYFTSGESFVGYLGGALGLVALFVLPPVVLLGMTLPVAIAAATNARAVGTLTAANTLASAAGALAAGFLLPQWLGLWPAFAAFISLFGAAGLILLFKNGSPRTALVSGLICIGSAFLFASGPTLNQQANEDRELLERWESDYGWVDVTRDRKGQLSIRQNLHYRHGSTTNAVSQYRQGRIPLLLHPQPRDVAFLGLGTGLTAAPAVLDESVESIELIELIPEVVAAARMLAETNQGVIDHPKSTVHVADARHHLLRTEQRFDLIVSDLFVPWESRTGYLYTVEFYETARQRLKPGGRFCQWLALYQLGPEQFEQIADSYASVFPHTTLWWGRYDSKFPIVALVGSEEPLQLNNGTLERRFAAWNNHAVGNDSELRTPADLADLFLGRWTRDPARTLNTDEHPWLEFTAPINHSTGRTLAGPALRRYFDNGLAQLPLSDVVFQDDSLQIIQDEKRRRAIQRFRLFGDAPEP